MSIKSWNILIIHHMGFYFSFHPPFFIKVLFGKVLPLCTNLQGWEKIQGVWDWKTPSITSSSFSFHVAAFVLFGICWTLLRFYWIVMEFSSMPDFTSSGNQRELDASATNQSFWPSNSTSWVSFSIFVIITSNAKVLCSISVWSHLQ